MRSHSATMHRLLVNEQLTRFYNLRNTASVIGEKEFVKWLSEKKTPKLKENNIANLIIPFGLSIEQIVKNTAAYCPIPVALLRQFKKGKNSQSTLCGYAILHEKSREMDK